MVIALGCIAVLLISFFGVTSALAALPTLLLINVFRLKNQLLLAVLSFFLVYLTIDFIWYYLYDYHLSFLLLLLIVLNNLYGQISGQLYGDGLKMIQGESIAIGLFAIYTFIFIEFNWV